MSSLVVSRKAELAALASLSLALIYLARRHRRDAASLSPAQLADELRRAEARADELRQRLARLQLPAPSMPRGGEVRIWMDGAFDMFHYGHANAFRQGRALGTYLVVGINDDESITKCKGPPLLNDEERIAMVGGCKFVDEIVPHVPYIMNDEYLRYVIQKYRIDYVVHGDDPCIVDGVDVYASAQALGKYRTIPRTEGVSTTEIVGRMLTLTTSHHHHTETGAGSPGGSLPSSPLVGPNAAGPSGVKLSELPELNLSGGGGGAAAAGGGGGGGGGGGSGGGGGGGGAAARAQTPPLPKPFVRDSLFMTTTQMLGLFASNPPPPKGARVVYVDGGWDMFHAGHVQFLAEAAKLGDYLLVGVHSDNVIHAHRGANFPILNVNERVLSVVACRHVGDVVIGPPWHITKEMLAALNVSVVAHGSVADANDDGGRDPYAVPKAMGIFQKIDSVHPLTVDAIMTRINDNHQRYANKIAKKRVSEQSYYDARYDGYGKDGKEAAQAPAS